MAEKRKLFEEVSGPKPAPLPAGRLIDRARGARGGVRLWLMVLFFLVALMIAVGGLTRLTDSGLSITEWRPVTGALPPMSDGEWQVEFDKYKLIPQYELINQGLTLAGFKAIYWWEWSHRQLGRVIGLIWALGFAGFVVARNVPPGWTGRLLLVGGLGGLQGAVGWWMVSSGLEGRMVAVASYRLAVHLGLAFLILGVIAWYVFQLGRSEAALMQARRGAERGLFRLTSGLMVLIFVQIILGALVAGIDAGRAFPTWPSMNGEFFPSNALYTAGAPLWTALFENPGMVQFLHRMMAYAAFAFGLLVWWRARGSAHPITRRGFDGLALVLIGQVALGIVTVVQAAPWQLGIAHQITAVALWVLILRARHLARWPVTTSLRGRA